MRNVVLFCVDSLVLIHKDAIVRQGSERLSPLYLPMHDHTAAYLFNRFLSGSEPLGIPVLSSWLAQQLATAAVETSLLSHSGAL